MSAINRLIFLLTIFCTFVYGQKFIGDVCTLQSTGQPGVCKLFSDCLQVREELQNYNRYPQTGTQLETGSTEPIVCCPKTENGPPQRKPGEVSREKCREYTRYVFEKKKSPSLLLNAPEVSRYECGNQITTDIVGGVRPREKEFPHMAAIGFEPSPGDISWLCGGTIVSEEYILTAAHCLHDVTYGFAQWVKLGVIDITESHHAQIIKISTRIPHNEYKSSSRYHDIALLTLEKGVALNPNARPACLYAESKFYVREAIATGWGKTKWEGEGSAKLLKVTIDLFDHAYCNSSYKNRIDRKLKKGIIDEIQFCAGSDNEMKDTCQGDSGGPLQIYHMDDDAKCMYDIIGVTSFGKACTGSPGVYVRVSHYVKWIEDIVWPQS